MEHERGAPKVDDEMDIVEGGEDSAITEETEQFLRKALEDSNRYGMNAGSGETISASTEIHNNTKDPNKPENKNREEQRINNVDIAPQGHQMKQEIAARLRKRIQDREQSKKGKDDHKLVERDKDGFALPKSFSKSLSQSICNEHKKKEESCPIDCPNRLSSQREVGSGTVSHINENDAKGYNVEMKDVGDLDASAVTKLEQSSEGESHEGNKGEQASRKEIEVIGGLGTSRSGVDEDSVEGFLIYSDGQPTQIESRKSPEQFYEPKERYTEYSLPTKKTPTANANGKPGSIFGPQVVKRALMALGGRASAVAIAEWIAVNRPQYLNYFGSQKKLRYSVSGILSARTYSGIFQKKLIIQKGIRKADWLLIDDGQVPEENAWDEPVDFSSEKPIGEEKVNDDTINDLLSLSKVVTSEEVSQDHLENPYESRICQVCNEGTNDDQLLLCDNCDLGYHLYCLDPPLDYVPQGAWYCECCHPFMEKRQAGFETMSDPEVKEEDVLLEEGEDVAEGEIISPRACEKHRRWKKRCPDNCPMRAKLRPGSKKLKFGRQQKIWRPKRKIKSEIEELEIPIKRPKTTSPINNMDTALTYIEMIEEAINALGGRGTTPDITNYMEEHHGELLATKTKTWRNSVSGCLSTHFVRAGKDKVGRTVWNATKIEDIPRAEKERFALPIPSTKPLTRGQTPPVKLEGKFKVPPKFSQRVYDPRHLEELRKTLETIEPRMYNGIQYINKANPLEVQQKKLSHPGAVMRMSWSTDGTMVATASTLGSVKVWDTSDWNQLQELKDKDDSILEEFYCVAFSRDDKKIIAGGRSKDKNKWDEDESDYEVIPPSIKIFDILSGKLINKLEAHTQDILSIKVVVFNGENFILSTGQDGAIIKWRMNHNFTACFSHSVIADQGTKMAIHSDFVPDTGNKFFVAACDSGLKIYDFETEQVIQSFPGLYTYLCDCVEFVIPKELKSKPNETFLLTKGVELLNENDEVVRSNSCHLRKLVFPEYGQGKFRLEEVNTFTHPEYKSNIWMLKLGTNGRYILSPTTEGRVFVWNIRSSELVAILHDHANREVRDILFHPSRRLLLTCGDDSVVRIYEQTKTVEPTVEFEKTIRTADLNEEDVDTEAEDEEEEEEEQPELESMEEEEKRLEKKKTNGTKLEITKEKLTTPSSPEDQDSVKRRGRGLPGACEKHRKEHVRCSADCPNRKL